MQVELFVHTESSLRRSGPKDGQRRQPTIINFHWRIVERITVVVVGLRSCGFGHCPKDRTSTRVALFELDVPASAGMQRQSFSRSERRPHGKASGPDNQYGRCRARGQASENNDDDDDDNHNKTDGVQHGVPPSGRCRRLATWRRSSACRTVYGQRSVGTPVPSCGSATRSFLFGGSYFDGHRLGGDEPLGPGGSPTPRAASSAWGRVNAPA